METDFDIAIVGYGPVGHVTAALLGRAGHRVAVFDRQLSLYPLPRIGHLDHEIMRIVQAVGAVERFEREAAVCPTYDWVNAAGDVLIHFDWSRPEVTGWHPHYLFYQPDLDEVLAEAVETQPNVHVARGWEATTIAQGLRQHSRQQPWPTETKRAMSRAPRRGRVASVHTMRLGDGHRAARAHRPGQGRPASNSGVNSGPSPA